MEYVYKTQGTCSTNIELNVEDGVVKEVAFWGGCNGNLQGISRLVKGMKVEEVIKKLEGVRCGGRPTSCPDQLCRALHEMGYGLTIFLFLIVDCKPSANCFCRGLLLLFGKKLLYVFRFFSEFVGILN